MPFIRLVNRLMNKIYNNIITCSLIVINAFFELWLCYADWFFSNFWITLMFSEWLFKCCCCSCIWKPPHWLVILYYPEGIDTSYKGKIPFSITITRDYGKTEYIYFFFCSLKVSIYIIMFSLILTVKLYINFDLYIR